MWPTFHYLGSVTVNKKIALLILCLLPIPGIAEIADDHGYHHEEEQHHQDLHPALKFSDQLTLLDIVIAAEKQAPETRLNSAFQDRADAQKAYSSQFTTGQSRLYLNYLDDSHDQGSQELEAGIGFNLWHLGQKRTARTLAKHLQMASDHWKTYLQWQLTGKVRQSLHALASADLAIDQASQALADARQLLAISQQRVNVGDAPKSLLMQGEALVIEARQQLIAAEAVAVDAARGYQQITGLDQRPAQPFFEKEPVASTIPNNHPWLLYLEAELDSLQTQTTAARQAAAENVSINFGVRRDRSDSLNTSNDNLSVGISIPFGGSRSINAQTSAARVNQTEAEVNLYKARQTLNQQLHDVKHALYISSQQLELSAKTLALHKQHWQMQKKAFALGESDIFPTIQSLRQYHQSQKQQQQAALAHQALISELNQTLGLLP